MGGNNGGPSLVFHVDGIYGDAICCPTTFLDFQTRSESPSFGADTT